MVLVPGQCEFRRLITRVSGKLCDLIGWEALSPSTARNIDHDYAHFEKDIRMRIRFKLTRSVLFLGHAIPLKWSPPTASPRSFLFYRQVLPPAPACRSPTLPRCIGIMQEILTAQSPHILGSRFSSKKPSKGRRKPLPMSVLCRDSSVENFTPY